MSSPCPFCSAPITLMQCLSAPSPWHLKCSQCANSIRLKGWAQLVCVVYLLAAVAAILMVAFIYATQRSIPRVSIALTTVGTMLGGVLLEVGLLSADPFVR
jgi:hypothetical protein